MTTHGHLPKSSLPRSRVPGTATGNALAQGARRSPASAVGEAFDLQASAGNLAVAGLLAEGRAAYDGWERAGIDQGARARFEAGFGEDFSAVRIEPASERGAFPRARAVTEEEVIRIHRSLVNRGDQTVRVIGHELAHVVQSRRGHVRADAFDDNERGREGHDVASDHAARLALDREADTAAGLATRGEHASIRAGSGVPQAQTWEWPSAKEIREGLEDAALTVTLGPLAGPIVAATTTSEERAAAVESSRQAVNSAVNWVEDTGAAIDEFVVEQVGDVPVVGHLARGATAYRAFQSEVAGGAVKAVSDIAHGLGGAALNPVSTVEGLAFAGEQLNQLSSIPRAATEIAGAVLSGESPEAAARAALERRVETATTLFNAVTQGYQESIEQGRYGEVPGRLLVDIGSFFLPGGPATKAGNLTKVAQTTRLTGGTTRALAASTRTSRLVPRGLPRRVSPPPPSTPARPALGPARRTAPIPTPAPRAGPVTTPPRGPASRTTTPGGVRPLTPAPAPPAATAPLRPRSTSPPSTPRPARTHRGSATGGPRPPATRTGGGGPRRRPPLGTAHASLEGVTFSPVRSPPVQRVRRPTGTSPVAPPRPRTPRRQPGPARESGEAVRDAQRRQEILAEFEEAQGLGSDRARAASRGVQPRGAFPSSPQHHLIPREFVRNHPRIARLLRRRRIDIDEFTVRTRGTGEHSAVHSVNYNSRWERFFAQHPNATRPQILGFMHRLRRIYRIHDLPIERYVGPTTRTRRP